MDTRTSWLMLIGLRVVVGLLSLQLLLSCTGSGATGAQLDVGTERSVLGTQADTAEGGLTFLTTGVCLSRGSEVEIVSVTPSESGTGMSVSDFTVWDIRDDEIPDGTYANRSIAQTPAIAGSRTVTRLCDDESFSNAAWLVVELDPMSPDDGPRFTPGFTVGYRSGDRIEKVEMLTGLYVCTIPGTDEACDAPNEN